ncbi:site-specific integrase [Amycolatopsis sp. NPDC051371]|uniref:tyrosine-type recombinase/integrase n=1 Tax=Amycolatopsis sp. NPDC051371 TaxID=3155800 RepID=UPI003414BC27
MFVALARANATRERPLSSATFVRIRGTLHAALNGAIRVGVIERNPAHLVELPSGRRPRAVVWTEARVAHWRATGERPPVAVWTVRQTAGFLEHARGHPMYVLYLAVALLGLRRGEATGLRWCDLDLDAAVVQVSHQVQDRGGRTVVCPPKTETSVRTLALDHGLVAALRALRAERRQERAGEPVGFLFTNRYGGPLSPGHVTHAFRRLVAEAGLPPIRLHDLRHGAASLSLAAGNDLKVVQAMLGHSSIVLTADTYTSVLPCLAHQAAEATAALVLAAARNAAASLRGRASGKRRGRGKGRHARNKKVKDNGRQARSHSAPRRSHP